MTKTQERVYKFLLKFFQENERFPTYREIMEHLDYTSPAPVQDIINRLEKQGAVERKAGRLYLTGYRAVLIKIEA